MENINSFEYYNLDYFQFLDSSIDFFQLQDEDINIWKMNNQNNNDERNDKNENVNEYLNLNSQDSDVHEYGNENNYEVISVVNNKDKSIVESNYLASLSTSDEELKLNLNGSSKQRFEIKRDSYQENKKDKKRLKFDQIFPIFFNSIMKILILGNLISKKFKINSKADNIRNREVAINCLKSSYEKRLLAHVFQNNKELCEDYENLKDKENYRITIKDLFNKVIKNKSPSEIIKEIQEKNNRKEKKVLEKLLEKINKSEKSLDKVLEKFFFSYFN